MMQQSSRLCEVLSVSPRPAGRSFTTVRCGFCDTDVQARLWSLAGSGKRCECGAVLHGRGAGEVVAVKTWKAPNHMNRSE